MVLLLYDGRAVQQQGEAIALSLGQRRSGVDGPSDALLEPSGSEVTAGVEKIRVVRYAIARERGDASAMVSPGHLVLQGRINLPSTRGPSL